MHSSHPSATSPKPEDTTPYPDDVIIVTENVYATAGEMENQDKPSGGETKGKEVAGITEGDLRHMAHRHPNPYCTNYQLSVRAYNDIYVKILGLFALDL